jgi:hypothetical protein
MSNPGLLSDEEEQTIKRILGGLEEDIRTLRSDNLNDTAHVLHMEWDHDVVPRYKDGVAAGWEKRVTTLTFEIETPETRWKITREKM